MIQKNRRGFTLVEILLVVIIIGILAAMIIPNIAGRGEDARRSAAKADIMANLSAALDMYEIDNGRHPTSDQGLAGLISEPTTGPSPTKWKGPYLKKKKTPVDPWGRNYIYASPGIHNPDSYDLSSYGSDGIEGSDDIVNWEDDSTNTVNQK